MGERDTTEALVESFRQQLAGSTVYRDGVPIHLLEQLADALITGPLAPILADLQRVTAERDEARADQKAAEDSNDALNVKLHTLAPHGSCACSYDKSGDVCMHHSPALAAIEARAAQLQAEVEAKDRALKAATDKLEAVCSAISVAAEWERAAERSRQREDERLRRNPLIRGAVEAARAATAREGQADA